MDLTRQKFHDLTALEPLGRDRFYNRIWRCLCICGREAFVNSNKLKTGGIKSCGCRVSRVTTERNLASAKHGHARTYKQSPTYRTWRSMIDRCEDPAHDSYPYYGGRGIQVCRRWRNSFARFLEDMGERPTGRSLERLKVNKGYAPTNCAWATTKQQARNRRDNVRLTYQGQTLCLVDWAEKMGCKPSALRMRLVDGWSVAETLGIPVKKYRSRSR